jgi:hypothetical protein
VNTQVHIGRTASGNLVGTSDVVSPGNTPVVPPVPAVPTWLLPSAPAAPPAPAAAPAPAYAPPWPPVASSVPTPIAVSNDNTPQAATTQGLALQIPSFFGESLFKPLPGTKSRGVSFSEWESYRSDATGRNILITTDDSNFFKDRNGKLNGNTGDTDASGLNVTDATDSVIRGTESADHSPNEQVTQAVADIAKAQATTPPTKPPTGTPTTASSGLVPSGDTNTGDPAKPGTVPQTSLTGTTATSGIPERSAVKQAAKAAAAATAATTAKAAATTNTPAATAAVLPAKAIPPASPAAPAETNASGGSGGTSSPNTGYDFPYVTWLNSINGGASTAVHTDEGTTLASGQEAVVIGGDGYDDDDNRATGENIIITRDDDNVVIGGTGDVNAQIGDSEQGAVIMGVTRTFVQGGGAY